MVLFRTQALVVLFLALVLSSTSATRLQAPSGIIPNTYFGLHIHHLDQANPTPWPNIAVPAWRLWDAEVNWSDIEPGKGRWDFGRLDRYVALAGQHGTKLLLPLGGCPVWASARPQYPSNYGQGFTAWPENVDDWRVYVSTVVSRYKGKIEAYEIWNEPNLRDFWIGNMDQMLTLTKEAAQIIHSIDPNAVVVSPSATADYGVSWLSEFLRKGGGSSVDVIGYHFYVNPHTKAPEDMIPLIQGVRHMMAANDVADKPLWNTESGWLLPAHFESETAAAGFLARAYMLAWAANVQRFYWYAWDNRSLAIVTYNEPERRVTQAGHAYEEIEQWLVGARMENCTEDTDHDWICQLSRSGKKQWVVWNPQGAHAFAVPTEWHVSNAKPLLGERHDSNGLSVNVGPEPTLLTMR